MTKGWLITPENGANTRATIAAAIPVLETERLHLRAPRLADWPVLEPIWTTQRGEHIGGPFNEEDAYLDFTQSVASWTLRGFGPFVVTDKDTGDVLGFVGLFHDFGDPEAEAGWLIVQAAEGKGIATEALHAALLWIRDEFGSKNPASFIGVRNDKSVAVAKRVGATLEDTREHPDYGTYFVYRHHLDTLALENGGTA